MGEWIGELIDFVVIALLVWRYVVPPVRTMMRNQKAVIAKQVEDAKKASERLAEAETKYSDELAEARTEAATIRDQDAADGKRIVEDMGLHAEREIEPIRQ